MAFALVVSTSGDASGDPANTALTPAEDFTGVNLIVVAGTGIFGEPTLTDTEANSYTGLTLQDNGGFYFLRIYYCVNPVVSASMQFQYAGVSLFPALCVQGWSGADTSPFDQQNGVNTGTITGGGAGVQTGSVTPTTNDQLVIAALRYSATITSPVIDLGFTVDGNEPPIGGQNDGCAMAYLVQTTATAVNPEWSDPTNNSGNICAAIATFKAAGGGGGATYPGYVGKGGWF